MNSEDELAAVALLAEPARLELYRYVRAQDQPVGRAEAAQAVGISVKLAAFHLDRLVEAEMLDFGYERLSGRAGPGAGRPAKVYTLSAQRFAVSLPQTGYSLAASIMATALSGSDRGSAGQAAVQQVAGSVGQRLGLEVRRGARTKGTRRRALLRSLEQLGYEPERNGSDVSLRNCIFADLALEHRELICGMNGALVRGMVEGVDLPDLRVERQPFGPSCCCARIVDASRS